MGLHPEHGRIELCGSHGTRLSRATGGPYTASIVTHGANARLGRHAHGYGNITLLLDGALSEASRPRDFGCERGALFFRAPGEPHSNRYGPAGCRSLIIDVPIASYDANPAAKPLYDSVHMERGSAAGRLAACIARELEQPDDCSALAIEGLVLELLATAARSRHRTRSYRDDPPRDVTRAMEYLRAHRTAHVTMATLARAAGASPSRLVRRFREHHGMTPATSQRMMRAQWAAEELVRTDKSIAQVAVEAGFSDQSHLTRVFQRVFGATPGSYRNRTIRG